MERGLAPAGRHTGLAEQDKAHLILMINGYVFWMARLETELAPGTGDPATDPLVAYITVMHSLVDDRWPAVKRAVDGGVFDDAEDTRDADFQFGLDRILDGIETLILTTLRMRAASTAALRALSTPTQATGTPGGICEIESSASSPPATDVDDVSGTPITGRSLCAATTPGSAAERPAPAMITLQAPLARGLRVLGDLVGVAMRRHHVDLVRDPARLELLGGLLHRGHVGLRAHDDADLRAHAAMSRRRVLPSKSITSAAAYAAARAVRTSSPSAVTLSTRPPAVTIAPSRSAVPACVTSIPRGTPPNLITSPDEDDCG